MSETQWTWKDYLTYLLLTLVFLSSWTDINGIFAELPQIVLTQPEGWKLGAYLALVTNLGNVAPLALVLLKCLRKKKTLNPVPINYVVIVIGMLSCFLLIFFWKKTSIIREQRYSTALLVLALFLSLLDCTSSVSFADYVQRFHRQYTSTIFLGESLTSILPSLLAVAQGNGQLRCLNVSINGTDETRAEYQTARFSVSIYFLCLLLLLTISFISFVLLQWTSIARTARQNNSPRLSAKTIEDHPETKTNLVQQPSRRSPDGSKLNSISYVLLSIGCTYNQFGAVRNAPLDFDVRSDALRSSNLLSWNDSFAVDVHAGLAVGHGQTADAQTNSSPSHSSWICDVLVRSVRCVEESVSAVGEYNERQCADLDHLAEHVPLLGLSSLSHCQLRSKLFVERHVLVWSECAARRAARLDHGLSARRNVFSVR